MHIDAPTWGGSEGLAGGGKKKNQTQLIFLGKSSSWKLKEIFWQLHFRPEPLSNPKAVHCLGGFRSITARWARPHAASAAPKPPWLRSRTSGWPAHQPAARGSTPGLLARGFITKATQRGRAQQYQLSSLIPHQPLHFSFPPTQPAAEERASKALPWVTPQTDSKEIPHLFAPSLQIPRCSSALFPSSFSSTKAPNRSEKPSPPRNQKCLCRIQLELRKHSWCLTALSSPRRSAAPHSPRLASPSCLPLAGTGNYSLFALSHKLEKIWATRSRMSHTDIWCW